MNISEVHNLRTGGRATYSLSPKEAVVAAFRQLELKDFNWWETNSKVPAVEEGKFHYFCGDYGVRK